jgi:hypothetical protein
MPVLLANDPEISPSPLKGGLVRQKRPLDDAEESLLLFERKYTRTLVFYKQKTPG